MPSFVFLCNRVVEINWLRVEYIQAGSVCGELLCLADNGGPVGMMVVVLWWCFGARPFGPLGSSSSHHSRTPEQGTGCWVMSPVRSASSLTEHKLMIENCQKSFSLIPALPREDDVQRPSALRR